MRVLEAKAGQRVGWSRSSTKSDVTVKTTLHNRPRRVGHISGVTLLPFPLPLLSFRRRVPPGEGRDRSPTQLPSFQRRPESSAVALRCGLHDSAGDSLLLYALLAH
jgi:hypothetical protein